MRLESRGHVRIRSADPEQHPSMLFNFLSTEADRRFWIDAFRIARDLLAQPAFDGLDAGEVYPGDRLASDEGAVEWIAERGQTGLHPASTGRASWTRR